MVFVHVRPVVVGAAGKTSTTRVLSVLSDSTVAGTDMAAVLARLAESRRHRDDEMERRFE